MIESGLVIKNVHFRGVSSSDYIQKNEGYVMMSKGRGKGLPFDQSPNKELLYSKGKVEKCHYSTKYRALAW